MHTRHFSLQAMRATGRHRWLLWPLLGMLVLMLQPVQACCTLVDDASQVGHTTGAHHPDPDSHCGSESPNGCQPAAIFRIKSGLDDIVADLSLFPHTPSTGHTLASPLAQPDLVPPVYPPPWLLTRRLRI